ncbi:MAG TPA: CpsD/CapB family tyrosine-protein kinase [Candidatus Acidoferrales bacterium]|nr:CpsD/CapB family tyrosine-protein kinase [Candidatus Acidoferrales bacterium]
MSRLYEALRKSEVENQQKGIVVTEAPQQQAAEPFNTTAVGSNEMDSAVTVHAQVAPTSHLVAMTEPQSLAAEKFRVLVTRLNNIRSERELKSMQVTSGVVDEGKTLVAANLAVTLARHSQSRVLLIEGDLHNPALHSLFGLSHLKGLNHWWNDANALISNYIYRVDDMPLWYLPAGARFDQPADVLQSGRFSEAFAQIASSFDWIVVDSTPLLPMADPNIWNRLVDGTLLVVREGVAPIKALKKGLASLDNPKLIGVVLNGATEFDRVNYYDQYYAAAARRTNGSSPAKERNSEGRE